MEGYQKFSDEQLIGMLREGNDGIKIGRAHV